MKKFKYIFIPFILLCLFSISVFAQDAPPIFYPSPRVAGMGGAYTAYAWGPDALFFNPAGYSLPGNRDFFLLDATIKLNGDSVETLKSANQANFDAETLLSDASFIDSLLKAKLGIGLSGVPFVGWIGGGFGLGVFDTLNATIVTLPSGISPKVKVDLSADVGAILGYSFHLGPLYIGANVKYFYRLWTSYETGLLSLTSMLSNIDQSDLPFDLNLGQGIGFDIGTILKFGNLQIGLVAKDIGTNIKYYTTNDANQIGNPVGEITNVNVPMQINTGIAWKLGTIIPIIMDRVVLTMDIHDLNGFIKEYKAGNKYTLGTKIFLGAEGRVLGLFKVRGGLYQGYPAFGLTVNLHVFQFNFAYFTKELSEIPGLLPEQNFLLNISIIW